MRIIYEGALFPGVGGGPRHFAGLSDALVRAGVEVTCVLPASTGVVGSEEVHSVVALRWAGGRVLRQITYELSRVLLLLRWWVTGRRFDVWMSRQALFGVGLFLARLVARQVVLEVNGPIREEVEVNFGSRRLGAFADLLMRAQVRGAHSVVAVTPGLASYTEERAPGSRCVVVPNGAEPGLMARSPDVKRDLPLVFAGALTPWYEMDVVLCALARLRDEGISLPLVVLGDGVQHEDLERLADALGINHLVTFTGWVDSARVRQEMERARVGLLPLRPKHDGIDAVGSPLKLYEYVAAGLQVVGTDLDGIADSPVHEAVRTYRQGQSDSCAAAIRVALDGVGDPPLDSTTWSWDARATQLLDLAERGFPRASRSGSA